MRQTMERLSARLPAGLAASLRQYAAAGHISLSEALRSILTQYFTGQAAEAEAADAALHSRAVLELILAMTPKDQRPSARRSALGLAAAGLKRRVSHDLQPDNEE